MAVQANPPIQIDPSMDKGHQLAFINQNFQSIANVLQSNSFKIVATGTVAAPAAVTVADGTNTFAGGATTTVAHGLSFTPLVMAFVAVSSTQYSLMPYSQTVSANDPGGGIISTFYRVTTNSTNVEVFHYVVSYSPGIGAGTYSGANIKYYLLQETAIPVA